MSWHITYRKREGVTRDGAHAEMFNAGDDAADGNAFAERIENDRHHFLLIVSPGDAAELEDLRGFTRDLMKDRRGLVRRLFHQVDRRTNTENVAGPFVDEALRDEHSDDYFPRSRVQRDQEIVLFPRGIPIGQRPAFLGH